MIIQTTIAPTEVPGEVAYYLKCNLEGIARGCKFMFRRWNLPPLYESGVRFRLPAEHGTGFENFSLPLETYQRGCGDCDNLIIWRLCELYNLGDNAAGVKCDWVQDAYHVLIRRGDGQTEDPSKILIGMYGR